MPPDFQIKSLPTTARSTVGDLHFCWRFTLRMVNYTVYGAVEREGVGDNAGWFWPFFLTNRQWMVSVTTVFVFWPMSLAPSVDFLRGVSAVATGANEGEDMAATMV